MSSFFDQSSDAIFSGALAAQSQRANLAQYAIQQAARFMQDSNYDAAAKEFKKALAFDAQNDTAHTYLGKIYLSQNKTKDAIKEFKETVRLQPLSVTALVNLGNAQIQDKNYTDAEKSLKNAARMDPLNPLPDYTLGHLYIQTDRLNEAEAQFKKVQRVSPRDANVFYSLGMAYNKQGKYGEAATNLEKALSLKSGFAAANYELGVAYHNLGEKDKAQAQLSILNNKDKSLASDLEMAIGKPGLLYMNSNSSDSFSSIFGPGTPLWMLAPTELAQPDTSKTFSVTIGFDTDMDIASVMNPQNWTIGRANSAVGGYYNNTLPTDYAKEVKLPKNPLTVSYNSVTREATVNFTLSQNAEGNATIDPRHLVFGFNGVDAAGRKMDPEADQIDGYALKGF
ncbi:MAG: tetratricopeptide repeat protein [Trichlorobacter sp.]|uniref:tetratricopeptide repeat protein n=1 Tax=Trichlorobacter sp. TaxID=2911007 RepID=UPI00255DC584|nr:tetratricopeptide repeat protein [Trichlorobacter sp.]MDK9718443.1 tetratricopeptide repeat protein [Trichlorobacter sp.]